MLLLCWWILGRRPCWSHNSCEHLELWTVRHRIVTTVRPSTSLISGNSVSGTLDNADDAKSIKKKDKEAKREEREIRKELKARHKAERQEAELEKKNERRARKGLPPKTPRGSFAGHGSFIGTPMQRRVANAYLVEHWANEDILWLVLMKSEGDRVIQDIELAES
ncbi:hypothetical protein VKT23_000340 [Stygiomarasmius scandens]|uniref:Uncharacterized protein n=1 Tax=Marasmiellus scandens TaxID=2682957 RepID=A0ABR1K985_9AGAR